jgi:hypothetical protein
MNTELFLARIHAALFAVTGENIASTCYCEGSRIWLLFYFGLECFGIAVSAADVGTVEPVTIANRVKGRLIDGSQTPAA